MKQRLKKLAAITLTTLALGTVSYPFSVDAQEPVTVTVGVVGDSTEDIWKLVQENLGDEIALELVTFTDGIYANAAQAEGDIDLTAFQHHAFLNQEIADKNYELTAIGDTFISPMNIYSNKITSIDELPEGADVLVPNNATNLGRALLVLEEAGVIEIDDEAGYTPDITDITANPKNINIIETDPAMIAPGLDDADAGIANSDLAIDFGLDPVEDSIFQIEIDPENEALAPFVNIIVARTDEKDKEVYQKIVEAYQQANVGEFIVETYNNAMLPVFKY